MRLILLIVLITVISFVLQLFLPWWIIAVVVWMLTFLLGDKWWKAFLAGFIGIALGWLAMSLFMHFRNDGLLTAKVATLLTLPSGAILIIVTALLGGLVGGFSGLAGYCSRRVFR